MSLLKWQTGKVHVKMSALGSKVNKNAFNEIQFIKPMLCNRLLLVILQVIYSVNFFFYISTLCEYACY